MLRAKLAILARDSTEQATLVTNPAAIEVPSAEQKLRLRTLHIQLVCVATLRVVFRRPLEVENISKLF